MEKSNRRIAFIGFAILMVGLGISDSLRGIFSGIFQTHFALTAKGLSTIIAVSYAGNLCFLLAGGRIMDKIDRKKAFLGFLAVWMCAMLVFLLTDNYYALLVGMFLAMGASTLLNTSITLITPFIFATSPAMIVNVLFFTQGIGTSGGQSLIGNLANDFGGWKAVTGVLFAIGVLAFLIILKLQIPDSGEVKKAEKDQQGRKMGASNAQKRVLDTPFFLLQLTRVIHVPEHAPTAVPETFALGRYTMHGRLFHPHQ